MQPVNEIKAIPPLPRELFHHPRVNRRTVANDILSLPSPAVNFTRPGPPAQPARRLEDILNETLKFSMPAVRAVLYLGLAILCFNVNIITVRQRLFPFVVSP